MNNILQTYDNLFRKTMVSIFYRLLHSFHQCFPFFFRDADSIVYAMMIIPLL